MRFFIIFSALLVYAAAWPYTRKQEQFLQNMLHHNAKMDDDDDPKLSLEQPVRDVFAVTQNEYAEEQVAPALVIAGLQLTATVLTTILDRLGNIGRKIAIGVENHTGKTWRATSQNVYFESGTSDKVLPYEIPNTQALVLDCRKTNGLTATGTAGVFTYTTSDGNTIAVMWSVPFDYNLYSNWWNVLAFHGKREANEGLFDYMYSWNGNPFKGNNQWQFRKLALGYKVRGTMTGSGQSTLEIHVEMQ